MAFSELDEYKGGKENGKRLKANEWSFARAFLKGETSVNKVTDIECFNGIPITVMNFATPAKNDEGKVTSTVAAAPDVSEKNQTEKAVYQSEEKFRTMADNISQLAWMADNKGWRFWYNQRWFDYTGTTSDEMQGWGWKKLLHPDHVERVLEKIQHSWNSGEVWEDLFPLRNKYGQYRWFLSRAVPVRDKSGEIIRWFGTNTDVTQQREYEDHLKKNIELFENLLYITAHDLKGPIANMHMALNLIENAPDEKKIEMIGQFRQLVNRLDKTINGVTGILKVQKADEEVSKTLYFESVLNDILIEFKDKIKAGVLEYNFSAQETIRYIGPFLYSIMKNLISNAIKYSRDNVPLQISVSTQSINNYTLLTIKDNGTGIDMDQNGKQLFSPFQRFNKKKVKGTGIGLYIIKNIIEKNDGYIEVESTPGEGTAFYCYLKPYGE